MPLSIWRGSKASGAFPTPMDAIHEVTAGGAPGDDSSSLFARLLLTVADTPPATISFEDLTGVSLDNPQLALPYNLRIHTCRFCLLAKASPDSHQHCVRNKMAANRVAIARRDGFAGQCHLGLTDLVKPLIFQNIVVGVFYYGSFVLVGSEASGRDRIGRFCRRHNYDPAPYLAALDRAPRVDASELPRLWQKLDLIAALATCIMESIGVPVRRYRTRPGAQFSTWNGAMPSLVRTVLSYINQHFSEEISVGDLAARQKCNPDYLSRVFKRTVGSGIIEYLHRIRIDHARRLLQAERFTVGEIGFMVGFQDHSHFGKVFRRTVGVSPQGYRHAVQMRSAVPRGFSAFEYSSVRPFNPKIGENISEIRQLVM